MAKTETAPVPRLRIGVTGHRDNKLDGRVARFRFERSDNVEGPPEFFQPSRVIAISL